MTPAEVLQQLLQADPARPRVTYYDDSTGERIELSAKVLANWVAKAGNLLQDELDVQPGGLVALDLPAEHWRTLYWALACWSVAATVTIGDTGDAAVLITTGAHETAAEHVIVTLPALARSAPEAVPAGAIDEARELSTYGDQLTPWAEPTAADIALRTQAGDTSYADLVIPASGAASRRALVQGDLEHVLRTTLAVWADDGSVVLVRAANPATLEQRLIAEGVTTRE